MLTSNVQDRPMREMARRFARDELAPYGREWERAGACPDAVIARLGELGFLGLRIPVAYGGTGASYLTWTLVMEEIAAGNAGLSTLMHVHAIGAASFLVKHGTERQKTSWLPRMATGEAIGAFCLTEPSAGSDPSSIRTRAIRDGDGWRISGSKRFITNGAQAKLAIVLAVTDPDAGKKGISAFLVDTASKGYGVASVEEKLGQTTSDTANIVLDDLYVSGDAVLGQLNNALPLALSAMADGRVSVSAQAVGIAQIAYEHALNFAKGRVAFGKPIFEHQAIAFKLADMATQIEIARAFTHKVASMLDGGIGCLKEASMAKLFAGEMAEKVCTDAIHIYGGYGYLKDFAVERFYRDVRVCQIYEGTNEIQRMIIARTLF